MRKTSLALAVTCIAVVGFAVSHTEAADACKAHKTQTDCSANAGCTWDTHVNKCKSPDCGEHKTQTDCSADQACRWAADKNKCKTAKSPKP